MLADAIKQFKIAIILMILFSVLTGLIYPGAVTVIAQIFFPWRANGSLIDKNAKTIGSELIGQSFTSPVYFWGRPSATVPYPNNTQPSTGSNLGPMNPDYLTAVKNRINQLQHADTNNHASIPVDLVTTSASGLDPDISPYAAYYQVSRIALARHISENQVRKLIDNTMQDRFVGVLGEPRVNVLKLNLALDALDKPKMGVKQ